jgi:hypothetical protein
MKLVSIVTSPKADKKLMATFSHDGREKHVHFGAKGMDDYTLTHDKDHRERYRGRHAKDLKGDPTTAGYLSYYIFETGCYRITKEGDI